MRIRVGDRRAPARLLGVWLVRREQQLCRTRLDAVVTEDQRTKTRNAVAPGLAAVLPERSIGVAVAQSEHEAIVAVDASDGGAGVPVADFVAHAQAKLV